MHRLESPFYRENHTKRVTYETTWIDREFSDWLEAINNPAAEPAGYGGNVQDER